jgi:hypothetical protein
LQPKLAPKEAMPFTVKDTELLVEKLTIMTGLTVP